MKANPHFILAVKQEFNDWRLWTGRGVVLAFAAVTGLTVVAFTWLTEHALALFFAASGALWWSPLLWTPASTAMIVWLTRRYAFGAAGSGIPQVMAALSTDPAGEARGLFVSVRLTLSKMLLTTWGLLAGLSLGREGPSVQIAAGVMHHARHWLPMRSQVNEHGLLMAGGAAGIAAAFNTPLGGVMFAIEELSRRPEQRSSGLLLAAIVLAGLMSVSIHGNATYFGVIKVELFSLGLLLPGLIVAVLSGALGGLFSRLMVVSLAGRSTDWFSTFRKGSPIAFAACCGLCVAILGSVSNGDTYGSGYAHTRAMVEAQGESSPLYVLLKFLATWITAWSGVPGGIFAPSLAIGGAIGHDVAQLVAYPNAPTLIAIGMAGFLAAVTQAPMTAFIIVMEMVDGHALVLSLMASALVSSGVSRLISAPLYPSLAALQLDRVPLEPAQKKGAPKGSNSLG